MRREVNQAVEAALVEGGFPFCFIGGLAVQRWGEPRMTVDATVMLKRRTG